MIYSSYGLSVTDQQQGLQRIKRQHSLGVWSCWFCCLFLFMPEPAYAYLDPGTGSMLLSAVVGVAATAFFMVKSLYYKAAGVFFRFTGTAVPENTAQDVVFYSEGRQYWNTFKPVLQAFDAMGEKAVYLASSPDDPGLSFPFSHVKTQYIGQGNRAFAVLNMLEADMCVLTTPGLDVLQIHRSPGVRHYAHIVHAVTDTAIYKLYAFDYYDSVLCSGPHQIRSLRHLEQLRGTPAKQLLETGCLYMDVLAEDVECLMTKTEHGRREGEQPRLLVAPTWGRNGLLSRFGMELLRPLAESGYPLTIRPHPQSFISEKELMDTLAKALQEYPHVQWDKEPNGLVSMMHSDVLISDLSGIVFDYAFVFERPVITVQFTLDTRGLEAGDLPWLPWEVAVLPQLGAHVTPEELRHLPEIVASLLEKHIFGEQVRTLREQSLFHFRNSGKVAAEQLLALKQSASCKDNDES